MEWVALAVALVGAVIGPVITWKIAKRQKSGTIQTSEAADLWRESESLRKEYKDRAERLEGQLEEVNRKLDIMTKELNKLRANSDTQLEKIKELKDIISKLRQENKRLLKLKQGEPPL
jgi:peptidoglycan hydrolase CwlO-like protein